MKNIEEIVKKVSSLKDIKINLLKEAKEDKLLAKDEIKKVLKGCQKFQNYSRRQNFNKKGKSQINNVRA